MLAYFYFLVVPSLGVFLGRGLAHRLLLTFLFVLLVLAVGLRDHVGMDWNNYLAIQFQMEGSSFWQILSSMEPGYGLLAWFSSQLGWGVYGANVAGAIIFTFGLFSYARTTKNPFLAIYIAIPYLVFVVAMSASRQTIAIGLILYCFSIFQKAGLRRIVFIILLAATISFQCNFYFDVNCF